ncbi:MAG: hypothetical protein A3J82_02705 [Elusimicrobia bacterium RIFOXYA2_FULL_69_6]|nr:MAG: hypothetical protein A3J82_02705 [Elusimicrobia bacterium RIFOXYA2_FULL_69_6]
MDARPDRLLIIEDSADVRKLLVRLASLAGWEAVSASGGPEALGLFKAGRFSLLLSDIDLSDPEMDGIAAAKRLLALDPGLRVVMMSGDPANVARVLEAGLGTLLPKPLDPAAIIALLGRGAPRPARPNCVLLVEDDPAIRELLARYIDSAGWQVVAVQNSSEALRIFAAKRFSILLADVMLQDEMDGIELARRLTALEPGLQVVLISGVPGIADKAAEAGVGPLLRKPVSLSALAGALGLGRPHREDGTRRHVLVIEDDESQREEYRRMLEDEGYVVAGTGSAEEGLALLEGALFDIILTDNILPGMTGLQAIPEFKRRSKAPILLMTSHPSPDLEKDALLLGAAAFLPKPLELDRVAREIKSLAP